MLSRALSLATVTLLIGCFSARPAQAQATNLEAGKSPSQIFAGTCTACHKSPRGLLKTVPAGSLQGFLRQHYTTSPEMATLLSSFLISNGATDTHYVGNQGRDAKPEAKPGGEAKPAGPAEQLDRFGHRLRPAATQEAARPQAEPEPVKPEAAAPAEPHGRNAKRLARPGEVPEGARPAEGQAPAQTEGAPEGRKSAAKQRLSRRGKPAEELPKTDAVREEPAKDETPKSDSKSESAKVESGKTEGGKTEGGGKTSEGKSESAKIEAPKETGRGDTPALRADPVPPVTPAPSASPAVSAAASGGAPEPAAAPPPAPAPVSQPAVTASAPPLIAPAGPPAPPISQ